MQVNDYWINFWVWTWFWEVKIRFPSCSSKEADGTGRKPAVTAANKTSFDDLQRTSSADGILSDSLRTSVDAVVVKKLEHELIDSTWWRESYVWVSSSRWTKHSTITFAQWQEAELVTNGATHDFQYGECWDIQWFLASHDEHHSVHLLDTWWYTWLSAWRSVGQVAPHKKLNW